MTDKKNKHSIIQLIAIAIIIFIAATGGMYFGASFNKTSQEKSISDTFNTFSSLTLLVDSTFPDVQLLDKKSNIVSSLSLLREKKTVVLFIDSECPPCHDISNYWQKMITDQKVLEDQIVAISFNDYGYLEKFINDNNFTFSVYTDPEFSFLQNYGVDAYPFALIVDKSGVIIHSSNDSEEIIESFYDKFLANE